MDNNQHINPLIFKGQGETYLGIWIVNVFLSIVTLGIYSAWAKVRTKRYFYGSTELAGDVFEYHGTPGQILKGRLVALVCVLVWALVSQTSGPISAIMLLGFYLALPWLLWSNARFDSAMTSYRNVHFSFEGSLALAYKHILGRGIGALVLMALYIVVITVTAQVSIVLSVILGLGALIVMALLYSWVVSGMMRYFVNGYRYGDWAFSADIKQGVFSKIYLSAMAYGILGFIALSIVTIASSFSGGRITDMLQGQMPSFGIDQVMPFVMMYIGFILITLALTAYTASRVRNYLFSCMLLTHSETSQLKLTFISQFNTRGYMWLILSNFLLQVVSLGFARPWVMVRSARYVADNTRVVGDMSLLVSYDQPSNVDSAISDELAQAFDLNLGIG